jgi:hypothetical protein
MARRTKSDQVFSGIVPQLTPPLNVMSLKVVHRPARLTSPSVTSQALRHPISRGVVYGDGKMLPPPYLAFVTEGEWRRAGAWGQVKLP